MKKYLLVILVVAWYINPIAYACSVVSSHITNEKGEIIQVMTGRTQDYELGILHTTPVKGAKGTQNTSHVNIGEIPKKQAVTWQNKYKYIGIPIGSPVYNNRLNEGINTQGLYAAQLALPQVTSYPNPKIGNNQPKILGVLDFVNYVLGTSKNVKQAINNLKKVQVVASGLYDSSNDRYHVLPVHWFLKDKTGHGAVIEFINGEMKIYSGKHAGQRINALTNAPSYDWQVKHYKSQKSKFKQNNTSYQVDGIYANGSGYKGLAGDYMPQSRFVRIKTILNALPSPYTEGQLNNNVQMILNSVTVPIGMESGADSLEI
jgi:penicillin V acylase-like amidase (Ntn superfamily)